MKLFKLIILLWVKFDRCLQKRPDKSSTAMQAK